MTFDLATRRSFLQASLVGAGSLALAGRPGRIPAAEAAEKAKTSYTPPRVVDGRPDTLLLTWRRDPTTTMTVLWVDALDGAAPPTISYAAAGEEAWRTVTPATRPYPAPGLDVVHAELTGLTPGTQYRLRLGDAGAVQAFQTMPEKATDTFAFVSGGDSGANPNAYATNLIAAKQDPMFALIAGDIAYDNGVNVRANLGFLRNYSETMLDSRGRMIPLVPAIGNHEVATIEGRVRAPFYDALFARPEDDRRYGTLDFGDYLSLVLLDTGHMHPVAGAQADWLDGALAARTERPHLIVAQHVPSYPSHRSFDTTGAASRAHWVPLFEKHNVDVVLEHHDHTFKRTHGLTGGLLDRNGLVYLGDGSWGAIRPVRDAEKRPYLAKAASDYHVTLHRLEGPTRYHLALAHGGRVADVLMTGKRPRTVRGRG